MSDEMKHESIKEEGLMINLKIVFVLSSKLQKRLFYSLEPLRGS
jgi:hypothetical protein